MKNTLFWSVLSATIMLFVVGCSSVKSTENFYKSTTSIKYPEKPDDAIIWYVDNLNSIANRKYIIIGTLGYEASEGWDYIEKSIQYNGRKNGADAFIVRNSDSKTQSYQYYVPGYTEYESITTNTSGTINSNTNTYGNYSNHGTGTATYNQNTTTLVPVQHPGYTATGTTVRNTINCDFIVFLDKSSWGRLGFKLEDIATGGVIVSSVQNGTPAQKSGLLVGDILVSVGHIEPITSKSQYHQEFKGFEVGKPLQICINRNGKEMTLEAIPISEEDLNKLKKTTK